MELLEVILRKTGLQYISDLNDGIHVEKVREVVKSLPAEEYTQKEWEEAISYLSGGTVAPPNMSELKLYLEQL